LPASDVRPVDHGSDDGSDSDIRPDDVVEVSRLEDGGAGSVVVDVLGVVLLSGRVEDQVEGKTEDLDRVNEEKASSADF